nr:hypothetical protein [Tanacetum cinerariifolium]
MDETVSVPIHSVSCYCLVSSLIVLTNLKRVGNTQLLDNTFGFKFNSVSAPQLQSLRGLELLLRRSEPSFVLEPKQVARHRLLARVFSPRPSFDDTMNEDTPVGVASAVKEGVTPSMVDMTVEMEKQSFLENTTVLGYFPSLSTLVTSSAGNAPDKSSYANVTGKPNGKKLNICTMFTLGGGDNGIDVVVSVESIRPISERFANITYGFFLGNEDGLSAITTKLGSPLMLDYYTSDMCMQSWGRSSYARVMIELRADVELKDNIVVALPKITGEGHYICNVRIEYKRKPPRCASCKVFGHIHKECPKNTSAGEKKTVKKPSQTSQGVSVGLKIGFKLQKEYRHAPKKPTANASGNKKKGVEPTIEVSNSNPFEVLNSVDNDEELGTNGGTTNLVNNGATSSGSSFMNVDNSSIGTTPIIDKIEKLNELLTSGQAILVDEAGNPLKKVEFSGDYDSEDEVASVDNDMARSMASERVGFGT